MSNKNLKLAIGFITYGKFTAKYLPYFLPSLTTDLRVNIHNYAGDIKILAFDNSEEDNNENIKYIKKNYPEIEIMGEGENFGFAKAYNRMIKRAEALNAEYFLALNPDVILEKEALKKLVGALDNDSQLASASPKVLKWNFENNSKTNIIDTCGIKLYNGLRFVNAGERENADYSNEDEILGPSGTAAIYRMSALEKVKEEENYFDELMFMYKEDCDLAYRLHLAGFKSRCVSDAIIYHSRSASAKGESDIEVALNRRNKSKDVKKWSFLNQQIIFLKYWRLQSFLDKVSIIWYELKMLVFILLFEQYLLGELVKLFRIKKKIKRYK